MLETILKAAPIDTMQFQIDTIARIPLYSCALAATRPSTAVPPATTPRTLTSLKAEWARRCRSLPLGGRVGYGMSTNCSVLQTAHYISIQLLLRCIVSLLALTRSLCRRVILLVMVFVVVLSSISHWQYDYQHDISVQGVQRMYCMNSSRPMAYSVSAQSSSPS